ncbi:hypothetical protein H4R19_002156 [Coemansia spiralis]|nr:hypothetical protein H4R19_002156 [Coemansia spiralis]
MAGIAAAEGSLRDAAAARGGLAGGSLGALRRPLSGVGSGLGPSVLYGATAEERVVLDVGSFTLRAGFSGDQAPLHSGLFYSRFTATGPAGRLVGHSPGLHTGATGVEDEALDDGELDALVMEQLRAVYRSDLLVDAKARKVAVVESALLPARVKRAVARVLLCNLRVPQVSFYPAAVAALMSCGAMTGLVVDCGHRAAAVVPVYDGRPLNAYVSTTPMAGHMLLRSLRALLCRFAKFVPAVAPAAEVAVDSQNLDYATCARVLRDLCSVSPRPAPRDVLGGGSDGALGVDGVGPALARWFESSCTAAEPEARVAADLHGHGRGVLRIPAWVLERAAEPLLAGDAGEDHPGLVDTLIGCIGRVPVDTRRQLVGRVLVVGGVADMPGFPERLLADLAARLRVHPRWSALADGVAPAAAQAGQPADAFRPSQRPWIGVSLAVAAKFGGVDVRRDEFDGHSLPDWTQSAAPPGPRIALSESA